MAEDEIMNDVKDKMNVDETKKEEKDKDITKDGGVIKNIIKEGEGWEMPEKGADVKVHYVGTLLDGTQFDSSRASGKEFEFVLGVGNVIRGWDAGVATMKKGEIAKFVIKPEYGYGSKGAGDKIPPNSTLVFEIELISFVNEKDLTSKRDFGVLKKVIKDVEGWERPNEDAKAKIHYIGKLKSNDKVFENTRERGEPVEIIVGGDDGVIPGLDLAVENMKKGEVALVTIQPEYGYGKEGNPALNIPPNATLVYEIELVDFQKAKEAWDMEFPEKVEVSKRKKEEGNELYNKGKFVKAVKRYKKAVRFFENDSNFSDEQKKTAESIKLPCYLNLAACKLKTGDYQDTIKNCDDVLKIQPDNVKALFRKGQAYNALDNWDECKKALLRCLELSPDNADAKKELAKLRQKIVNQDKKDRLVYAGIFDKLSKMQEEPAPTASTTTAQQNSADTPSAETK